ncbi:heterokaryon incompatibility protein-domain-containing protein [Suillus subalutaceus]|uniref:heterokaryon incompatibility protein-domain-containing protein n=1 Tax=Suillus subalutaceus TaxID=48586 RepID=UPI001B87FD69|nr:heterokaryon incompatibility protein-domain-containing protein [Suillus subalutaceus]KAG1841937.1 heterokaryon incompatibility protein-domain-containing protein [Suillus subalutaceus]
MKTRKLEGFFSQIPQYAILSHQWRDGEVQFPDIDQPHARNMPGYSKIEGCCIQANEDGYRYVWIDTCCINKSSSSELSKAINSMFMWYKKAQICYAYLDDVSRCDTLTEEFSNSQWFQKRVDSPGAHCPQQCRIFSRNWEEIGSKSSFTPLIKKITGIDCDVLLMNYLEEVSVATRMSWAAGRQTTRVEDRAYSLLGLFGVYMPTIYGEGEKAFVRLQIEIMKSSNDQSIFAWKSHREHTSGLLASSPDDFAESRDVVRIPSDSFSSIFPSSTLSIRHQYSVTNRGVNIHLPARRMGDHYQVALSCCHRAQNFHPIGLCLHPVQGQTEQFLRFQPNILDDAVEESSEFTFQELYVQEDDPSLFMIIDPKRDPIPEEYYFFVKTDGVVENGFSMVGYATAEWWKQEESRLILNLDHSGIFSTLLYCHQITGESFAVVLGMHNYHVWSYIVTAADSETPDSVHTSFNQGERSDIRWSSLDWFTQELSMGRAAVKIRKGGKYCSDSSENSGGYSVTISITGV